MTAKLTWKDAPDAQDYPAAADEWQSDVCRPRERREANRRILDAVDPRFALTNEPPEFARDADQERSAPDTDGQKPTEERHRIDALAPLLRPVDVFKV